MDVITNLYKVLLKLDYHSQVNVFLRLTGKSPIGAFLIHGQSGYGQKWLLHRLLRGVLLSQDDMVISLTFRSWQGWDLKKIVRTIGMKVGLKNNPSLHEVIERVYEYWQRRSVVLIFYVNDVHPDILRALKKQFWDELVRKARERPGQRDKARLLLFLVDETGDLAGWPFDCADQPDASWAPDTPIKPPVLAPMSVADLAYWMEFTCEELPFTMRDIPAQDIWQQTNAGIPEVVLEHLCVLGDCDWSELERLWMRY